MNRLQSELHRLYFVHANTGTDDPSPSLVDASMRVRALVMQVSRPASWEVLARVWQAVQTELELPAPAIAVSGSESLQLWFSLAEPIDVAEAHAFLEALRSHCLPDIKPGRIGLMPCPTASGGTSHAAIVPAQQEGDGNWSAFIAPDLAPVFADTPWLEIPPGEEGQAGLLRGLRCIPPTTFEDACRRLGAVLQRSADTAAHDSASDAAAEHQPGGSRIDEIRDDRPAPAADPGVAAGSTDPRRFLLQVMNDATVALELRIDAARALLEHPERERPRGAA